MELLHSEAQQELSSQLMDSKGDTGASLLPTTEESVKKSTGTQRGSRYLPVQIILAVLGFLALAIIMVVPERHLFFIGGLPRLNFAPAFIVIVAAITLLCSYFFPRIQISPNGEDTRRFVQKHLPLLAFCVFNIIFVIIAYTRATYFNPDAATIHPRFWASLLFLQLAMLCAFYLGRKLAWTGTQILGIVLVTVMGLMLTLQTGEFFHLHGLDNPIGYWVRSFNLEEFWPNSPWIWQYPETVRAMGLGRVPSHYAFTSLVVLCWALSSKGMRGLRMAGLIFAVLSIYLAGVRTAFIALLVIAIVYLIYLAKQQGFFGWIRRNAIQLFSVTAILLALLGGIYLLTGTQHFNRGIPTSTDISAVMAPPVSALPTQTTQMQAIEAEDTPQDYCEENGLSDMLWVFTSGRTEVWGEAIELIKENPLGTWQMPASVLKQASHAHNDVLERLLGAGPISLMLYIWLIWWMAFKVRAPQAPAFPLLFATAIVSFGLLDVTFAQIVFTPVGFLILGYLIVVKGLRTGGETTAQ